MYLFDIGVHQPMVVKGQLFRFFTLGGNGGRATMMGEKGSEANKISQNRKKREEKKIYCCGIFIQPKLLTWLCKLVMWSVLPKAYSSISLLIVLIDHS